MERGSVRPSSGPPSTASRSVNAFSAIKVLGGSLIELFFPRRCAGCRASGAGSEHGHWCGSCWGELPWIRSPLCPCCGRPHSDSPSSSDHACGDCLLEPPPYDEARSATHYDGWVRERIHQVKFGGQLHWIPSLVELLVECWSDWGLGQVDGVVPVPLHRKRLQQRGFNQSALLARMVGRRLERPVWYDLLERHQWTEPQTRLKRQERLKNVAHAFSVRETSAVHGKSLLLIDDVFTTGSTIKACAKALKDGGGLRVFALTVARSLPEWKPRSSAE